MKTNFQLTVALVLTIVPALSAGVSGNQYVLTSWGLQEGLPQSSVNHIIQTRDGYLWVATFGGLSRFNGESFTTFNRSNTTGIKSERILSLYEDRSGAIWCSTERGLVRFRNGVFETVEIVDKSYTYSPRMIAEDRRGGLWISANAKPYRFTDSVFIEVSILRDSSLVHKALNDSNGIWIAHGKELLRTLGDSIVLIGNFAAALTSEIQSFVEFPKRSGVLWFATSGDGIVRYAGGNLKKYTTADGLPSNFTYQVYVDHEDNLWTTGFGGIRKRTGERFTPLKTNDRKASREFYTIVQDVEGNYWIGTPSKGLYRMRAAVISTIGQEEGLMEGKMLSITRLNNGRFLFGTNCGGLYEWDGERSTYSQLNAQLPNLCLWSVFEDSRKQLWIGSKMLTRFDATYSNRVIFDSSSGFDGEDVFAITEDSKGNVWIGCLTGVYRYDGTRFHLYSKSDGVRITDVRSLYEDASGAMWIGTTNGLFKFENNNIRPVPLTLDDTTSGGVSSSYVRAIHQDETGTMWFGTYGGGLIRMSAKGGSASGGKNGKFSAITTKEGLFDNIVSHIVEDDRKFFWMGCNRGIMRVSREMLNNVADGNARTISTKAFGTSDGMKSPETNGGFQPSVVTDGKETLLFPTVDGIAVVKTHNVALNTFIPPVRIEKIVTGSNVLHPTPAIALPYDSANMEIQYSVLSYVDRSKIRYKYMLEGLDASWTPVENRNKAYYTNIPPGTWTFRVIASNNDGIWNLTGDSILITITPPFWRTWWFYSIAGLLFVAAGPSVYYFRVTQLKKEKIKQQIFSEQLIRSQEQERRRIAMELHDGLGQQILVMKNRAELALNQVTDPVKTTEQLREIAQSAVSSINDIRSISHGLRPVHLEQFGLTETVKNLCEQLKQSSPIEWVCHIDDIDGVIPREKEINFYRILQEGTNNILRYSFATQASIMIRRSDQEVTASVWDNGKGFDPEQKADSVGMGLSGILERAYTLGGTCEITSQPNQGTTIMVIIPLTSNG